MKKNIHPTYFPNAKVSCACSACFEVGSTKEAIDTEVCFRCHPFYTGKEKVIDTAGRVEKFRRRIAKKEALVSKKGKPKRTKAVKPIQKKIILKK